MLPAQLRVISTVARALFISAQLDLTTLLLLLYPPQGTLHHLLWIPPPVQV